MILIVFGAFALMLPISTVSGKFPFIDAIFTSTSAVCVTGLGRRGHWHVLYPVWAKCDSSWCLWAVFGVMTFTSFFGLFFRGEASFKNQLIYKDFTGSRPVEERVLDHCEGSLIHHRRGIGGHVVALRQPQPQGFWL